MSSTPGSTPHTSQSGNRMERLDALVREIDRFKDEQSARTTREIVHLLMDLHGSALARILELIGPRNPGLAGELGQDELIGNLLVLYDLHPLDVETRVRQALKKANYDVEVLGIADGVARLRTSGEFPPKETLEQLIYDRVADVTAVEIETTAGPAAAGRVALPVLSQ